MFRLALTVCVSVILALAFLTVTTVKADGAEGASASPPLVSDTVFTTRLASLNDIRLMRVGAWEEQYDDLRQSVTHNWVDWSQDECSSPWYQPIQFYDPVFKWGCLRHDMMWRTLPVLDGGTGRIWNERNRIIADQQFRTDNQDVCSIRYSLDDKVEAKLWTACWLAANTYYLAIRMANYDNELTDPEEASVESSPAFIQYPSITAAVDCGPLTGRCLPVHYISLDGRPFSPQNLRSIATDRLVELKVVRAHLQYRKGPPLSQDVSEWKIAGPVKNDGNLAIKVYYPLVASLAETDATCPAPSDTVPAWKVLHVDPSIYSIGVVDSTWKTTPIFVRACRATTGNEESDALIEVFPRRTQYVWISGAAQPVRTNADKRVRHYENIKASTCSAIGLSYPVDITGALLGTDCASNQANGSHADYYNFIVPTTRKVRIDLTYADEFIDTHMYLLKTHVITGTLLQENDDRNSTTNNSRIERKLNTGAYTVVVTTHGTTAQAGDYRLHIRDASSTCETLVITSSKNGEWTASDCPSSRRSNNYVDYYNFTVTGTVARTVTINLTSASDPYMYLILGRIPSGIAYLERDDDDGPGKNARIVRSLLPGTYSIAATTYRRALDSYTLTVTGHR